jgi:anti-sigma factor RsiW
MSCPSYDWKSYALKELDPDTARHAETHLTSCPECRDELAAVRLTLDTLGALRQEEVPRRIAFVSDKVFEPRWWQRAFIPTFASPTFAAGALVAAAILIHGALRPGQAQVDAAVSKALSKVEARHTQEMQVMFEQLDLRDRQIRNGYLANAALVR